MSKTETTEADKSDKTYKALFSQRVVAFMIDILLISVISAILTTPFIDSKSVVKLNDSNQEIVDKYMAGEINQKTYFTESMNITYQLARKNGILTLVTLFLEVLYFIVFQFYKGGQTIGKKIMKIKVSSTDGDLTINQVLVRSLIIDMILLDMVVFGFVIFAPENIYFYGTLFLEMIQYAVIFISIFMICGKQKRGLHDLITHTEVIKAN